MVRTESTSYKIEEIYLDERGEIEYRTVRVLYEKQYADSFLELCKELKPESKFLMKVEVDVDYV